MDALYTDGTEAVAEMWAYGTTPAFTVVPTSQETATNSFSLFGGASTSLGHLAYFTIDPSAANTNDDACLDNTVTSGVSAYKPFPNNPTCSHNVNCSSAPSACTADCETAAQRTVVISTHPSFDGTACPTSVTTNCAPGMDSCGATASAAPAPHSSGSFYTAVSSTGIA